MDVGPFMKALEVCTVISLQVYHKILTFTCSSLSEDNKTEIVPWYNFCLILVL